MLESAYVDAFQVHRSASCALSRVGGFGAPTPRQEVVAYARRHGSLDLTRFYDGRVFSLEGILRGDSATEVLEALDALKAALALGSAHVFTWRREGYAYDETADVVVASPLEVTLGATRRTLKWAVDLHAGDPRLYSATLSRASYDPAAAGTGKGLRFPLTFRLVFEGAGSANVLEVDVAGTMDTPPTFTIHGPATNPVIDNETTGRSIYTEGLELAAGESAIVDVDGRVLYVGGRATYSEILETAAPAAWWKMDEASSAAGLADSSGNGLAGTWPVTTSLAFQAAGPLRSEVSYAVEMPAGGYADFGHVLQFPGVAAFTVSLWLQPLLLDITDRRIISTEYDDGAGRDGWYLSLSNSKLALVRIENASANAANATGAAQTVGTWYHVVAVFDGATQSVFVNGEEKVATTFGPPKSLSDNALGKLMLGVRPDSIGAKFNGRLSHVAVFDRALEAAEILTHYRAALEVAQEATTPRPDLIDAKRTAWGDLAAGVNRLRLRGDGLVAGQSLLEVSWRDARL